MTHRAKGRQEMDEERILEMLRDGELVRVLDLVDRQRLDKNLAEKALKRYRDEQGSLWRQLRHAAFG